MKPNIECRPERVVSLLRLSWNHAGFELGSQVHRHPLTVLPRRVPHDHRRTIEQVRRKSRGCY
jgi:hypothetical protein